MRLVLGAVLAVALGGAQEGTESGRWVLSSTTDSMTDKVTHKAQLSDGKQALAVSCSGRDYSVTFIDLDGLGAVPSRYVLRFRFDDQPATTRQWQYASQAAITVGIDALEFVSSLKSASRVRIQASSLLRGVAEADFDVTGASVAIAELEERCSSASSLSKITPE